MKKMPRYRIWPDSESHIQFYKTTDSIDDACDIAYDIAHRYDGEKFRVIVHIEDQYTDQTIGTYENINPCDGPLYDAMYGDK